MKVPFLSLFVGFLALNQTCPSVDDLCKTDFDIIPPYKASSEQCWSKPDSNKNWSCQIVNKNGTCPENTVDVNKCEFIIPEKRCPTTHDYCLDGDMVIGPDDLEGPNCWKSTRFPGQYTCQNQANCNTTLNYFSIRNCLIQAGQ